MAAAKYRREQGAPPTPAAADDLKLFQQAVKGATPIAPPDRVSHRSKPPPVPVQSLLDTHAALAESRTAALSPEQAMETGEELVYLREGLPRDTLRKLRRGNWVVQDAVDLHGLNRVQAREMLVEFLAECRRRRLRCVRVVHGKGLRSPNREPVLKGMLQQWLARRDEILAYCQAPQNTGGSGALLILLKP